MASISLVTTYEYSIASTSLSYILQAVACSVPSAAIVSADSWVLRRCYDLKQLYSIIGRRGLFAHRRCAHQPLWPTFPAATVEILDY